MLVVWFLVEDGVDVEGCGWMCDVIFCVYLFVGVCYVVRFV